MKRKKTKRKKRVVGNTKIHNPASKQGRELQMTSQRRHQKQPINEENVAKETLFEPDVASGDAIGSMFSIACADPSGTDCCDPFATPWVDPVGIDC